MIKVQILKVIYEGDGLVAIDKPAGINVHPGHGRESEPTIVDLVEKQLRQAVFLVHRLDRDTSGVLLIAKTDVAKKYLQKQFEKRTVQKVYLAVVHGRLKHPEATLDWPIARHSKNPMKRAVRGGGKPSKTDYKVVKEVGDYTLVEVRPQSGRTHQIRVHMAHLGHPVVGDALYGKSDDGLGRLWLHATALTFHDGTQPVTVKSPLPAELKRFLDTL